MVSNWAVARHPWEIQAFFVLALLLLLALTTFSFLATRPSLVAASIEAEVLGTETQTLPLEAEMLCELIQKTTQLDPHRKPGPQLVTLIQSIFELEAAAVLDADLREVYRAGEWFDNLEEGLQSIYLFETSSDDPEVGLTRRVLRIGKLPIGAMLLRGEISTLVANAIASVMAITFDRYHAFANESRTESARQTEQLRTTVLDSLAHAYKTPLTAIEAASSGLAVMGNLTPAQAGLVTLIEEQADQLSHLTTRLLKTARLEASDMVLHTGMVEIAPLIDDVVASLRPQLLNRSIKVVMSHEDLSLPCDRSLLVSLLTQYVDNASKYADAGTIITLQAMNDSSAVVFSVHNIGPLIPEADFERVFDRYYRCSLSASNAPGTGIGLSVAKRAAQAHGGHVWVTSDADRGTIFYASLPSFQEGAPRA